jgi:putative transposase
MNWNYNSPGCYFVTICTAGKSKYLGEMINGKVLFSEMGWVAHELWLKIPEHFPHVQLGEFVVMPDHVHGILVITNDGGVPVVQPRRDARFCVPTPLPGKNEFGPQSRNLGSIVRGFKAAVKKYATKKRLHFTWQPRFNDRIIMNEKAFADISAYIRKHPPHIEEVTSE